MDFQRADSGNCMIDLRSWSVQTAARHSWKRWKDYRDPNTKYCNVCGDWDDWDNKLINDGTCTSDHIWAERQIGRLFLRRTDNGSKLFIFVVGGALDKGSETAQAVERAKARVDKLLQRNSLRQQVD